LEIPKGAAARDFGWSQGGEAGASPQRAVMVEPTLAPAKRTAARRVFDSSLCCFLDQRPHFFLIASLAKTAAFEIFKQALKELSLLGRFIAPPKRIKAALLWPFQT